MKTALVLASRDHLERMELGLEFQNIITQQIEQGPAWTLLLDGEPAVVAGIMLLPAPGAGEYWSVTLDVARRAPLAYCKAAVDLLGYAIGRYGLQYIQMTVDLLDNRALRFAEWLGFQRLNQVDGYWLLARGGM